MDAKRYENLGNRLSPKKSNLTEADKQKTLKRQLDDTWTSLETALKKDGTTGHLSNGDGLFRMEPILWKGFLVEVYGGVIYRNNLDIHGTFVWFGTAESVEEIKGKSGKVIFETEFLMPNGFPDHRPCAQFLIQLVDAYRNPGSNRKVMSLAAETITK